MNGGDTAAGIILLIIFLAGVIIGVIVIVSRAFVREDKHYSVKGDPPDNACGGARRLVGFSHRDEDAEPSPEGTHLQGRPAGRSGRSGGDER
ncbi:MAG: hypothetical protein JWM19_5018 [Actinomycetia bacterium]|jgi:hypothetical protein|nr:hypothetical protein [Actinomycetes bacterium]